MLPFLRTYTSPEGLTLGLQVNDVIATIVGEVSRANLRSYVQALQSFQTRYTSTANCEAAGQFILNHFLALGLEVRFQPFTFGQGISTRNIVAEIRGRTDPEEIVIICGHYDSNSGEPTVRAPGADDDASGVAAVMEAARILAKYPLDFTVRFIAFSAEEWGLYGSHYHADGARAGSERIVGVVNLDMISYADSMPEDLDVVVNAASWWMAERTGWAADAYTGLAVRKSINPSFVYSDHSPFWDRGYSAFCAIEDEDVNNPYYHTPGDTIDTLNFDFFGEAARTALAALSDLAQPVRPERPKTPAGLVAESTTYASAFTAVKNAHLTWQAVSDAAGYNIYRSSVPHLGYVKINASPLAAANFTDRALKADAAYYYVVTAVWSGGVESNFSREAESPAELPRYEQSESGREVSRTIWRWQ
jgi:Zn-dependent M28 family amino/carboxypeptidase